MVLEWRQMFHVLFRRTFGTNAKREAVYAPPALYGQPEIDCKPVSRYHATYEDKAFAAWLDCLNRRFDPFGPMQMVLV